MKKSTRKVISIALSLLFVFMAFGSTVAQAALVECTHSSKVWKIDYEATADHSGKMSLYCLDCKSVLDTKEFNLHTHVEGYRSPIENPTCTTEGVGGVFCSVCGALFDTYTIQSLGHTFAKPVEEEPDEDVPYNEILFLIDQTGSIELSDPNEIRVSLANNIINKLNSFDKIAAVDFGSNVNVISDFTTDKTSVQCMLGVSEPKGKTSMYDALETSIDMFDDDYDAKLCSRFIILLTDGTSSGSFNYVSAAAAKGIKICTIGLGNYADTAALEAIAGATGGKYFSITDVADVNTVFEQVVEEIDIVDNSWITTIAPYCTTEGEKVHICSRCGVVIERRTIPALGHCGDISTTVSSGALEVLFLIDESGSMGGNDPDDIRIEVAKNLTDELGSSDKAAVVCFDNSARVATDFTTDKQTVKNAIETAGVYGGTDMYEGLRVSLSLFSGASNAKRYIVLLSDGDSYGYYDYATEAAQKNVVVYTVGLGYGANETELEEIATTTGGKYYFAEEAKDLFDIYEEITGEIVTNGCTWVTTITPTCCTDGEKILFCSRCGKAVDRMTLAATGHTYDTCVYTNAESHIGTCTTCGKTASSLHCWSEWEYNNDNTFFKDGTQSRVCYDCNYTETVTLEHSSIMGRVFYPLFYYVLQLFNRIPLFEG